MTGSEAIAPHVPYLRRYARALTGDQASADSYVRACLETLVSHPTAISQDMRPRVGLYWLFQAIWQAAERNRPVAVCSAPEPEKSVQQRLHRLDPIERQVLLLTALEQFSTADVAKILNRPKAEIESLALHAMDQLSKDIASDVMIIEDQSMIALDLSHIVEDMGHRVVHIAATRADAVAAAEHQKPKLILADVQLADNSSGIDAVNDIVKFADATVVFVTAYPERFLKTMKQPPASLITKPFLPAEIKHAINEALFLSPTERRIAH